MQPTAPRIGSISGERVNVRSGPTKNHHAFAQLHRGTEVVVLGMEGDWVQIQLPAKAACWISADHVSEIDATRARVEGLRVMVRVTPGTTHNPIGHVLQGETLRLTGRRDKSGKWLEFYAPESASAYVHKDYIEVGGEISGAEVARVIQSGKAPHSLAAPEAGSPGETAPEVVPELVDGTFKEDQANTERSGKEGSRPEAGREPPRRSAVPGSGTERLRDIADRFNQERAKPILSWELTGIRAELRDITQNSEDAGEIETAKDWLALVDGQIQLQAEMIELKKKEQAAAERLAEGEEKESGVAKAVHHYPPREDEDEFLATGWVVAVGKNPELDCTHKLMKGNRLLFFLKSERFDLDDYLNQCVGIRGQRQIISTDVDGGADVIQITEIQVISR